MRQDAHRPRLDYTQLQADAGKLVHNRTIWSILTHIFPVPLGEGNASPRQIIPLTARHEAAVGRTSRTVRMAVPTGR